MDGTGDWFDETGTFKVKKQIKGGIRELENRILEIDINLMKLAKSQQEREQMGTSESKPESDGSFLNANERMEQSLMGNEEELKKEFERNCPKKMEQAQTRERVCDCRW